MKQQVVIFGVLFLADMTIEGGFASAVCGLGCFRGSLGLFLH